MWHLSLNQGLSGYASRGPTESVSISPRSIIDRGSIKEYQSELDPDIIVKRFSNENPKDAGPIAQKNLREVELELLTLAKNKLQEPDCMSAKKFLNSARDGFPNNVILVDVFTRRKDDLSPGNEIRTICLWKKEDHEFVLIDPINADHTSKLGTILEDLWGPELKIKALEGAFYHSDQKSIGELENDFRDHIDIAVKIALKLNEEQAFTEIEEIDQAVDEIQRSISVLSNLRQVNADLADVGDIFPLRELQSSNRDTRDFYLDLLKKKQISNFHSPSDNSNLHLAVKNSDKNLAEILDQMKKPDIERATSEGYTALHLAVQIGSINVVNLLLRKCIYLAALPDKYGQTPLHWIAGKDFNEGEEKDWLECVKTINATNNQNLMNHQTLENGYTALHIAVQKGNFLIAQSLTNECSNIYDAYGQTVLHWLSTKNGKNGEEDRWQDLLRDLLGKMNSDSIKKQTVGNAYTALHLAIQSGNFKTAQRMIALRSEIVDVYDAYGQTPLHWLVGKNHAEEQRWLEGKPKFLDQLIEKMQEKNLDLIFKPTKGNQYTVLHLAVQSGNFKTAKTLMKSCPKLADFPDAYGQTALHWAASRGDSAMVQFLFEKREGNIEIFDQIRQHFGSFGFNMKLNNTLVEVVHINKVKEGNLLQKYSNYAIALLEAQSVEPEERLSSAKEEVSVDVAQSVYYVVDNTNEEFIDCLGKITSIEVDDKGLQTFEINQVSPADDVSTRISGPPTPIFIFDETGQRVKIVGFTSEVSRSFRATHIQMFDVVQPDMLEASDEKRGKDKFFLGGDASQFHIHKYRKNEGHVKFHTGRFSFGGNLSQATSLRNLQQALAQAKAKTFPNREALIKAIKKEIQNYTSGVQEVFNPALRPSSQEVHSPSKDTREIGYKDFLALFKKEKDDLMTDGDVGTIKDLSQSITSWEMNDCITVFAIEKDKNEQISRIMGYHIGSLTDSDEIIEDGFNYLDVKDEYIYEITIIGGNDRSRDLLNIIRETLPKVFKNHLITRFHYNLIENTGFDYISANVNGDGLLIFCKHTGPA